MAPYGVTIVNGHAPIPGAGGAGLGSFGEGAGPRRIFSGHSPRTFAGSSDLVTIARRALGRLRAAADAARAQCEDRGWLQRGLEWAADSSVSDTICDRADQLDLAYDDWYEKVNDPSTTDQQLVDILHGINNATDISDLIDLAESTSAGHVIGEAVLDAPGTVIGWGGEAVGTVASGILGGLPWWVWVGAAGYGAYKFGLISKARSKRNGK